MSLDHPVIAVIGAGAVGGYYGARLAQHGADVHFHMRGDCVAVREKGLHIRSRDGDFSLPPDQVHVYDDPKQMPKSDLVLVTLKTTANGHLSELVSPLLKDDTILVTLQNGLGNEQLLADLFGAERIIGGMAFVCINRLSPGVIGHSDHGLIELGEFRGPAGDRLTKIGSLLSRSKIPCRTLDDLLAGRWGKLVWNVPFNGLGAALDLTTDRLIGTRDGLELVRTLMHEVIAAAGSLGVRFADSIVEEKLHHTSTMGPYKTSMQIDRQLGRPMEIEAIIGQALRTAKSRQIPVPALQWLYHALRLLDAAAAGS